MFHHLISLGLLTPIKVVKTTTKRPAGLLIIVIYKAFSTSILALISVALLLAVKNYQSLVAFSESYTLEGKLGIIHWFLNKVVNLNPRTLQFSGIAIGLYSAVTAIETIGLWYQKVWAKILVLVLVGISIPPEIFELFREFSLLKLTIFVLNVFVFGYLLRNSIFTKNQTKQFENR